MKPRSIQTSLIGEFNELGESVGESKREEKEKEKRNSDVQSSQSLTLRKNKWRHSSSSRRRESVTSIDEEPEGGDEVSPTRKRKGVGRVS
ncbi:unnamed protein product [Linum trigynum]|uniref:Uncharacterized protein n=1 Tax=Linum trigynum TaxID=586398 RepID=A0AAV2F7R7_9ROSI